MSYETFICICIQHIYIFFLHNDHNNQDTKLFYNLKKKNKHLMLFTPSPHF